jgi:hypothetical protein
MSQTKTSSQAANLTGSLNCPRCKNPIRFPIQALLQVRSLTCTHCGLELEIDLKQSGLALQELRKFTTSLEETQAKPS